MTLAPTKRCPKAIGGNWQIFVKLSGIRGFTSGGPEVNIENDEGWNMVLVENINFGEMDDGEFLSNHFWETRILCGGTQNPTDIYVSYSDYVKSSDKKRVVKAHKPPQIFKDFIKGFQCKDNTK